MRSISHLRRLSAIGTAAAAAAALAVAIGPSSSFATTTRATWTITPGGAVTGTAGTTTLKDTKTGTVLTCTSSTTSATLKSGSGQTNPLGSITAIAFNSCTGPLGLSFTVSLQKLPYKLNGTSYSAGTTKGKITGVFATLTGSGCSANVAGTTATTAGTVTGKFVNSTSKLSTSGGTLHIWNVSGCFGLIANGDASTFTASYAISPKQTLAQGAPAKTWKVFPAGDAVATFNGGTANVNDKDGFGTISCTTSTANITFEKESPSGKIGRVTAFNLGGTCKSSKYGEGYTFMANGTPWFMQAANPLADGADGTFDHVSFTLNYAAGIGIHNCTTQLRVKATDTGQIKWQYTYTGTQKQPTAGKLILSGGNLQIAQYNGSRCGKVGDTVEFDISSYVMTAPQAIYQS